MQEVLLAKRVLIVYGSQRLPFAEFILPLQRLKVAALKEASIRPAAIFPDEFRLFQNTSRPEYLMELRPKVPRFTQLQRTIQRSALMTESFALQDILREHYNTVCSDPRDCIYSILSLLKPAPEFEVNYDESVVDLFWRAGNCFNLWDLDLMPSSLADALSLQTWELRHDILNSPHKRISLQFERVTLTAEVQYNGEPQKLPCGKAAQFYCQVTLRTPEDIVLCPQYRCGHHERRDDHERRIHIVFSPIEDRSQDSFTVSFFKDDCNQFELDNELWQHSRGRATLIETW
jgi:hypothetical protein